MTFSQWAESQSYLSCYMLASGNGMTEGSRSVDTPATNPKLRVNWEFSNDVNHPALRGATVVVLAKEGGSFHERWFFFHAVAVDVNLDDEVAETLTSWTNLDTHKFVPKIRFLHKGKGYLVRRIVQELGINPPAGLTNKIPRKRPDTFVDKALPGETADNYWKRQMDASAMKFRRPDGD